MDCLQDLASSSQLTYQDVQLLDTISPHDIREWVKNLDEDSPLNNLELLRHLHDKDLLQITTYVHFCSNLTNLSDLICCYATSSNEHDLSIGSDVLCILMCVQDSVSCYEKCHTVLTRLVKYLATSLTSTSQNNSSPLPSLVDHLNQSEYRIQFIVNQFLATIVTETLSPEDNDATLAEVVAQQKSRFPGLQEKPLFRFLQRVLKALPSSDSFQLLDSLFTCDTTNWHSYLTFISAYLHSGEHNTVSLLEFIEHQWKSSLTALNQSGALKSLLLIRQCCLEQIKPGYVSYAHWFSNLPIRVKNEFEFFFSVLTQQVPHENAMFLKIHINKAPSIPLNCQATFSEYAQLAKTKLKDMNETCEYLGLFGTTEHEDRIEDVRKILSHFSSTNQIADILLKACVFRRDYYNETFLRDLLEFRDPALTRVQIQFVDKLYQVGKLPHAMYADWPLKS